MERGHLRVIAAPAPAEDEASGDECAATFNPEAGEAVGDEPTYSSGRDSLMRPKAAERPHVARGELDDATLVALAQSGELRAFEALYRRHAAFALNLATRLVGTNSDIEDIVHDGFLKAYSRLGELRDPGSFRSWLGSIVVNLARIKLRRGRVVQVLTGNGWTDSTAQLEAVVSPDADPEIRAQVGQLYQVMRQVPIDDRIAWTLRYVESHKLEAVAELTGCSLATAKRRIARAQGQILEHLSGGPEAGGRP